MVDESQSKETGLEGDFNVEVFTDPEKYAVYLSIDKVVADNKVSREELKYISKKPPTMKN